MRVAITGATGLLGRYLRLSRPTGSQIVAVSRTHLLQVEREGDASFLVDLAVAGSGAALMGQVQPDVVIHAAAEGRVDAVQGNTVDHMQLNVMAASDLAALCRERGFIFVFVSSNAVFGGSPTPYRDDSIHDPVNDYGILKSLAESAVMDANPEALIIRPLLMYGLPFPWGRPNPVMQWARELGEGREVKVVNDVTTQPLWAGDCAAAIWAGIKEKAAGAINVSGGESVTLFDLACRAADAFGLDTALVTPIESSTLTSIAPRPTSTAFDLHRLHDDLGLTPHRLKAGLALLRDEYDWVMRSQA